MQSIYMHQGHGEFNPEILRAAQQNPDILRRDEKRECDLWASPFNDKSAYTWEYFWYCSEKNYFDIARQEWEKSVIPEPDAQRKSFENSLVNHRTNASDFYKLSHRGQDKILSHCDNPPTRDDIDKWKGDAQREDELRSTFTESIEQIKQMARAAMEDVHRKVRDNSFFFTVDQDKILHIYSMQDIEPFIKRNEDRRFQPDGIDFEAIQAAGHSGIELHNARALRYVDGKMTPFAIWDVDSIAIWDPDCVHQIDREIAYISRMSACSCEMIDLHDQKMTPEHLNQWINDNPEKVAQAIAGGIITKQDVQQIKASQYDISQAQERLSLFIDREAEDALFMANMPRPKQLQIGNTAEWDLAKYCYEQGMHPIFVQDMTLVTPRVFDDQFELLPFDQAQSRMRIEVVGTPHDMLDGKQIADGKALMSINYIRDIEQANGRIHIEAAGCDKFFISSLDFSKEFQSIKDFYHHTEPWSSRCEHEIGGDIRVSQAPETIIDPEQEMRLLRETLALRCVAKGLLPACGKLDIEAYFPEDPDGTYTKRTFKIKKGMTLAINGEPAGTVIDKLRESGVHIIETDTHLFVNSRDADFTQEYKALIQDKQQELSSIINEHDVGEIELTIG